MIEEYDNGSRTGKGVNGAMNGSARKNDISLNEFEELCANLKAQQVTEANPVTPHINKQRWSVLTKVNVTLVKAFQPCLYLLVRDVRMWILIMCNEGQSITFIK